jgi:hypothetical protein
MKAMTLVVMWLSVTAFAEKFRLVSVGEATTTKASPYAGVSGEVTEWTVVAFEGAPPLPAMRTDGSQPMLFVGNWPCSLVWRGSQGWCVVPRLQKASDERLWGPVRLPLSRPADPAKIAQLRKGAEAQGSAVTLAGVKVAPAVKSETLEELLSALAKD